MSGQPQRRILRRGETVQKPSEDPPVRRLMVNPNRAPAASSQPDVDKVSETSFYVRGQQMLFFFLKRIARPSEMTLPAL
jgi:hypothetical protein